VENGIQKIKRAFLTSLKDVLFIALLVLSFCSYSQQSNKTVKGKVVDGLTKESVPYASIVIKSNTTNKIISGGITDDNGNFEVKNIPNENLNLEVQFIGYKLFSRNLGLSDSSKVLDLGVIEIEEDSEQLEGVEITAERSTIEQKIDRKIINVGKDLTTTGATAADIMINVPSINVDQDGNLSLRGNQNVRLLIDGKPTNISADQLLRQIPSTSIKKIELITNPSAKYNPEGMSGIVNVVLKKNTQLGFNAAINSGLTQGQKTRVNNSIDVNYRMGSVNVYANYGNNMGQRFMNGEIFRPNENSNQIWRNDIDNTSHLYKIGLDYYINDNNIVSVYTTQNFFDGEDVGSTDITYLNNDQPDLRQGLLNFRNNNSSTYNFDYKHNFNDDGHTIELEADYNNFDDDIKSEFDFQGGNNSFSSYVDVIKNERENLLFNLDYVNPISDKVKIELGAESRLRRTDNIYNTTSTSFLSSDFSYDMDIHSLYGIYNYNAEQWSYQIGARFESYKVNGVFDQEGQTPQGITDDILTVYPSLYVNYVPDPENSKNSYQISYSRRVDRPSVDQVNPIRAWATPRITSQGNPDLRPQFTNSVELNHIRKINKGSITMGVFYRFIEDEINRIGYEDPNDPSKIILSYDNYDNNTAYGFELAANYKFTNWWSANGSFDFYAQTQKGVVEQERLEVDNNIYNFRLSNSFKATKNLTFQLFSLYRGPNENLQFKSKRFFFVNVGGRYNFMDNKATVSLNFNDIFKTQNWAFDGERPLKQIGEFVWDSRTVFLGFSYRFGQGKNKSVKRKKRDKNEKKSSGFL
jgi:outer membrane receptor protein involved in Fe transport